MYIEWRIVETPRSYWKVSGEEKYGGKTEIEMVGRSAKEFEEIECQKMEKFGDE